MHGYVDTLVRSGLLDCVNRRSLPPATVRDDPTRRRNHVMARTDLARPAADAAAPIPSPARSPLWLWLYGIAMLGPAGYFAWRYPLRGNTERITDLGYLARYERPEFYGYVGGLALLYALYLLALYESRRLPARRALPAVFVCGAALAAVFAAMYPVNAVDLFVYAVRSRLYTRYGDNPIAALPRDYPGDPWVAFATPEFADEGSPSGPLWNLIAAPITLLASDRLTVAVVGFKALALVALLAGGWLVTRVLAAAPDRAATGALLYLWNPLLLWEGAGNGHNDVVMVLPLLLALLAWVRRRDRLVVPLLVVAALIKYATLPLLPVAAVAVWRRAGDWPARRRLVAWSLALSLAALVVGFYPFYDVDAVRRNVEQQGGTFLTSPATAALLLLDERYPAATIERRAKQAGVGIVLLVVAAQLVAVWRRPHRLPRAAFEVLYMFLLVAAWNWRAWYLIWLLALAALLPLGWPAWRTIVWTAGGLATYAFFIWLEAWWKVWWGTGFDTIQLVTIPVVFGPTLLLTLAELAWHLVGRQQPAAGAAPAG